MLRSSTSLLAVLGLAAQTALGALQVNLDDQASIKAAAKLVAQDLVSFYPINTPGWTVGILPGPPPNGDYYWWQGGAMWGTLIDYWHHTDDSEFNDLISQAMIAQTGDDRDYMPRNWSASMGNDDQAFWAMSAMLAAETGYQDPPKDAPQWLSLVQAVFNEQTHAERRAPAGTQCEWGLRWQVYPSNNGFDYINTIANACYFNLGARLARYSNNNQTYIDLAERTYDLIKKIGYISTDWRVFDGGHLPNACKDINKAQFSYNAALLLQGSAFLYNMTESQKWKDELDGLLSGMLRDFFVDDVAYEPSCEPAVCNTDMKSFKGYLHRWMGSTMVMAPYTQAKILPVLKKSAQAAVNQCTGGSNGRMCGFHWTSGQFDGEVGAGQQMNVLGALMSLITPGTDIPLTNATGGTSVGNFNAGSAQDVNVVFAPVTTGDKAGAGIATAILIAGALGAWTWMSLD
ncbi:family 76 glycoside hydrolase [Microdochium trichocladiopsis]|uniref:Mannan endo-1,6-alpha-mannosidase n=1 Tax=Microdochium trichocladiopsis TaxID=1682393 RepID=A0A9P9BSR5_9PEZI|nr:family 76 glycoside hydrolase [Microdochium trichocladiopsis]KAH7034727.1 family 76 glycoside hydrolase [Microdochium trichocladiopsis]